MILQRRWRVGRTSAANSQLARATLTDLKRPHDRAAAAQPDNHVSPRRVVRRRQICRRRPGCTVGVRVIDTDDLERRRTTSEYPAHRDVFTRVELVSRRARRDVAHRDRVADAAARADEQAAALARAISTGVRDQGSPHGQWQAQLDHDRSSARSRKCSSASGLASASRLTTGRPCTILRTASSTIFPLLVRGMSGTATIRAGTWRGEA